MVTLQNIPEAIPIGIAAVFSSALVAVAWRRRSMPMAPAFATMMAGETIWALCAALEPIIVELPLKRLCVDLRILGTIIAILGLMAFVFRYVGQPGWLTTHLFTAICAPAILLVCLAWTDPFHHLYFSEFSNQRVDGVWIARRTFGPAFWGTVVYCYALLSVSTILLVRAVNRSTGLHRAQAALMLFGVLLPWAVDILDMTKIIPFIPVDLVSPTFALTGLSLLPALFRFHLLDLPPIAWAVAVKGMDDPVVVIDSLGRIAATNPAADRVIGRTPHEIIGVEAAAAFSRWPTLAGWLRRRELHDKSAVLDGPTDDEASSFDARISPLGNELDPSGWVLVLRDVSERKSAEEERGRMLQEQAARAEAEAASRAKDRFLAALSHELRTPLTPILAAVTAMLEDLSIDDTYRAALEMIRRNVSLEARLIDDLLDMTRIRSGKLRLERETVDAHALIHHVVEICREDLRSARLELALELAARRHGLDADPTRFQQVLWNLVKNAIKFTPAGGVVTVRTRDAHGSPADTNGNASILIIEVSDTGIGIEPGALPRIFEIFQQEDLPVSRRSGGLGLGLMISRSIVEQHGGRLDATSGGRNRGATFRIEMPSARPPALTAEPHEPLTPAVLIPERTLNILLVDDNADTLNYVAEILTRRGNTVHTSSTMAAALQIANDVEIDVLVSDIELPDGSGMELMGRLHASRGVPGIALSGFGSSDDIELSHSAGFAEHLTKPVDFHTLERAIHRVAYSRPIEGLTRSGIAEPS